ncbi:MAG: hypothetical protein PQJ46_00630 [Spirochaetales bacterium]|nr:hypothetical protein [Spirochaetales bacterium]
MRIIKIFFLLLLFINSYLYSDDFFTQDLLNKFRPIGVIGDQAVDFKLEAGEITLRYNGNSPRITTKKYSISADNILLKETGYSYINVFGWEESILYGSRFFLFLNPESNRFRHGYKGIGSYESYDFSSATGAKYNETLIRTIEASSYLQEGETSYLPDNIDKYLGYFVYRPTTGTRPPMQVINGNSIPWVEGVDGPGIGEELFITFTEPCSDIVVLNGFVDRNRKHLFKANNRVRTAIIRSSDSGEPFEFEYHFEDMVRFEEILFPRPADKVIFEIKDVYPGEKWDDTCISAVLTREPDPYLNTNVENDVDEEEQEKKIYSLDER